VCLPRAQITHSLNSVSFVQLAAAAAAKLADQQGMQAAFELFTLSGDPKQIKTKWSANAEWISDLVSNIRS
jgi:hypothetical protein